LGTATAIAAGPDYSCAIQAGTGRGVWWGHDLHWQATTSGDVDGPTGHPTAPATGVFSAGATRARTRRVAWCGVASAVPSAPLGPASAISVKYARCMIEAGAGRLVCWGDDALFLAPPPAVDGTAGTAHAIAAGIDASCAIQSGTNRVVCWGQDFPNKPPI